jgi:hypothetical protein
VTVAAWETAAWLAGAVALIGLAATLVARRGPVSAARLAAAVAAARQRDAAEHLGDHDDLVQSLVVATYALQLGDDHRARTAVDGALCQSRAILDRALAAAGRDALTRRAESGRPNASRGERGPHRDVA